MIPSEVSIDGIAWTIEVSGAMSDFGETQIDNCKIYLREDVNDQVREITFWHELIHAMFASRDFKLVEGSTDEMEEQVASFLGPALWSFFKSNVHLEWD